MTTVTVAEYDPQFRGVTGGDHGQKARTAAVRALDFLPCFCARICLGTQHPHRADAYADR
jgi:hypothetical protein